MTSNLSDKIKFYPVSKYVNYPSNNDTECIEKIQNLSNLYCYKFENI